MAKFPDVPPFSNPALILELIFDSKLVSIRELALKNLTSYINIWNLTFLSEY